MEFKLLTDRFLHANSLSNGFFFFFSTCNVKVKDREELNVLRRLVWTLYITRMPQRLELLLIQLVGLWHRSRGDQWGHHQGMLSPSLA